MTTPSHDDRFDGSGADARPRYRPPVGLPLPRDDYRAGAIVSLGFHLLVLLLILTPLLVATIMAAPPEGAGGAGPAGGGGGGTRGTGGAAGKYTPERLRYIQIAPQAAPEPAPESVQPEPPPPEPPPEKKPEPEPTPPVSQQEPPAEPLVGSADAQVAAALPGSGGGTGDDGTKGTGPGTGGGVGSGEGTGRGSGTGPGTGGGTGDVYLPTPTLQVFPNRKPKHAVAGDSIQVLFDVDATGRVLRVEFPPTRDRGFDKYLAEVLSDWKFRPAVRADGTPVRATFPLVIFL